MSAHAPGGCGGEPRGEIDPNSAAVVLSTSGSTGEPKAAVKTHANLLLSSRHYIELAGATEADRFLLLAPVGFMASIPPLLCALLTGASLHPFNVGAEGVDALVRFIGAERITVYHSVPTLLRRLASVEDARESLKSVRLVRLAGEIVRPTDVRLVRELFPAGAPVQILMGAAETSLIAHHTMSFSEPMPEGVVPIGRAAPGVEVMILDERGNAVRTGEPGRLVVRGRTISPGYWNRLSERGPFVADADDPTLVMYQTSDTCRVREDGLLELLGRSEEFIKVRGVRVSPAAIEAALVELPDVRDAAVVGLTRDGEERAVAYVVARVGRRPRGGELRRALAAMLPEAMVPAEVMILPSLPLTASGKVDRHALPEPRPLVRPRWRRPRDDVEGQVAAAWEHVLDVERVGLDDRFDALGGTSIEALRVLLHLERVMARPIPDAAMMLHDSVEAVAAAVARENVVGRVLVPLKASGAKRPFFCVHPGLGTVGCYGALAQALDADRPFYALQSPGMADAKEWPLRTIEGMAMRYVREIERVDGSGPYLLGGVCMGGLVAWEMARRLTAAGREVKLVALIETYAPGALRGRTIGDKVRFSARHAVREARWLATMGVHGMVGRSLPVAAWPAWRQFVHYCNGAASRRYAERRYAGRVAIFTGAGELVRRGDDPRIAMRTLVDGPVDVAEVPGNHHDICNGAHIRPLAERLRQALNAAESVAG